MLIHIYLLVAHPELCRLVHIVLRAVYEPARRQNEPTPRRYTRLRAASAPKEGFYKGHQTAE